MTVSIVIPNFNGKDLLAKNLRSVITARKYAKNKISEIIIVDDASTDGSTELIKKEFPVVKVVRHKVNRGFAATANTGARAAKGNLVCLINNDVIVTKGFLEKVTPHFKSEKVFAVSLHEKGHSWASAKFERGFVNHKPGKLSNSVKESFWASGGSAVFRRSFWMKLKGMDEALFKFYWEDVDLSYRAQKRGWIVLWEPSAKVIHKHETTTSKIFTLRKMRFMQQKNELIFLWKNITSPNLFRKHFFGLLARVARHPGHLRVLLSTLSKIIKISKARKIEKKESKVSDEAIFAKFS